MIVVTKDTLMVDLCQGIKAVLQFIPTRPKDRTIIKTCGL